MTQMKKFIIVVIITNIIFVFMVIYKQSQITKLSYEQQLLENTRNELREEKEALIQKLYRLKNPKKIKDYATKKLGMKKMGLSQAKRINKNDSSITDQQYGEE